MTRSVRRRLRLGPCRGYRRRGSSIATPAARATVRPFTSWYMPVPAPAPAPAEPDPAPTGRPGDGEEDGTSLLDVLVGRLSGHGRAAHEVWLPPLGEGAPLDEAVGTEPGGAGDEPATLRFPLAVVDKPFEQRRDTWWVDLSGADGNVAGVGGTRAGKSTTLCTLVLSAAASTEPDRLSVYVVDLGGGLLRSVAGLPHVGGVAHRGEGRIRRTIAEVESNAGGEIAFCEGAPWTRHVTRPTARTADRAVLRPARRGRMVRAATEHEDPSRWCSVWLRTLSMASVALAARWSDLRPALRDALGTGRI